jgi:SAM-dependent methyltransferase
MNSPETKSTVKEDEYYDVALYLQSAIKDIAGYREPSGTKILDFGCGSGKLVKNLISLGYDVRGCDIRPYWEGGLGSEIGSLSTISMTPYRLPFEDDSFDVVVSTSVFEHAQNTEEIFRELHRVLRSNGYSMHLYPGKWYLPSEPHIYVPLVNFLWPNCPRWWLALWARLGIRNEYQHGLSWREVVQINVEYCQHGLCYLTNGKYRKLSREVFGNYSAPMEFYIANSYGGVAKLLRKLPFKRLTGFLAGEFRMNFMVQRKFPAEKFPLSG